MSKEIKIGIFGFSRGESFYSLMKEEDSIEIVAICERREECVISLFILQ